MYELTRRIEELGSGPEIDGIVVTQGMNTLETVSYFVDLCYDGDVPVVFTGAMRHHSFASPDGPGNLLSAVCVAMDEESGELGVLVAFNFRVHAAREVSKRHTQNPDSFRSPEYGPLGVIAEDDVVWRQRPIDSDPTFDPDRERLTNDVPIVPLAAEIPSTMLAAAADSRAVCLVTFGPGHLTPTVMLTLEDLRADDVPIVASTWCTEGALARDIYECYGCENTTRELCYYSDLTPRKTRIKTIVALTADRLGDAFVPPNA